MADMRIRNAHQIRFTEITRRIRVELAKYLDVGINANWEALVEELGFLPPETRWIRSRVRNTHHGSPTLLFFDDYCVKANVSLAELIQALDRIDNQVCVSILATEYGEAVVRTAFPALNVTEPLLNGSVPYPGDLPPQEPPGNARIRPEFVCQQPNVRDRSSYPDDDIWKRVSDIGNNFGTLDNARNFDVQRPPSHTPSVLSSSSSLGMNVVEADLNNGIPGPYDLRKFRPHDTATDERPGFPYRSDARIGKFEMLDAKCSPDNNHQMAADWRTEEKKKMFYDRVKDCDRTEHWLQQQLGETAKVNPTERVAEVGVADGVVPARKSASSSSSAKSSTNYGCLLLSGADNIQKCLKEREAKQIEAKHYTHPFSDKECQEFEETLKLSDRLPHSSTLPDVQHSPYVVDRRNVRVFVTYAVDSKQHRGNVFRLCECLKRNDFSVSLDARETHLLRDGGEVAQWHEARYNAAHFVLVLVSPVYRRVIDGSASPTEIESARNALHIYRRMMAEHENSFSRMQRSRFIAIVMQGSTESDVPQWMRQDVPVYKWPSEYLNLFYRMLNPANIISNFVQRREQDLVMSASGASGTVRSAGAGGWLKGNS